ncbi:hypothetical protein IEQ34_000475 [Dendrobium chrysotoxum]|uniref:Probable zinc-ribbon domain-containing protein n=1 Tax=Dendrobium chrysotoxum TaxID=161865 RepID=A0AAV7HQK1_DENCH|nr:hypothetical protein IEQ34_000475 [Dendrobium chrysotoxum]
MLQPRARREDSGVLRIITSESRTDYFTLSYDLCPFDEDIRQWKVHTGRACTKNFDFQGFSHSSFGEAKVHSEYCFSDNGLAIYLKQISNTSDDPKKAGQVGTKRYEDSKSNGEKTLEELESSGNGIKTLSASDSYSGSSMEKKESAVHELNGINERILEQGKAKPTSQSAYNLNQEVRKCSNQIDNLNSSRKLNDEQSPESLEHEAKNEEGNEELRNGTGIRWKTKSSPAYDRSLSLSDKQQQDHVTQKYLAVSRRTRSSHTYDRSFSSSSEHRLNHVPQKNLAVSRRTRSRKVLDTAESIESAGTDNVMKNNSNVEEQTVAEKDCSNFSIQSFGNGVQAKEHNNLFSSENHELSLISQSNKAEEVVKFPLSETDDQLKILEKVDELKIQLHRMFSNKSDGKGAPSFNIKVTHFEGKIESNDDRSSLFCFSRQSSNSSCLLCQSSGICCHNGNRRICQETHVRHCRPISGGAPFVICYKCYKLLQLPVDFLVSMKRIHKLRCGSCSEVLVYSFRPRSHTTIKKRS